MALPNSVKVLPLPYKEGGERGVVARATFCD